jgi:Ca2+-transporting ATPase
MGMRVLLGTDGSEDADAAIVAAVPLGGRDNMVFSGTAATYGHEKAVVLATGMRAEMGRIAGLLEATPDETTPLQRELDRTGRLLGLVVIALAVISSPRPRPSW